MQVTLNFLSPRKKADLKKGFEFAFAQGMLFIFFVAVAFSSGMVLALRMMLNSTSEAILLQAAGSDQDSKAVTEEIKKVNDYLVRQQSYAKGYGVWSEVLLELTGFAPAGVQYKMIQVGQGGKLALTGHANDRQSVLDLQAKLKASPHFANVVAPLSNILSQHDVDFEFAMDLVNPPVLPAPVVETKKTRTKK